MTTAAAQLHAARLAAARHCRHGFRVVRPAMDDDSLGYGDVGEMARWCADNLGPRSVDWYYRGGGWWYFRERESMLWFAMVWG
jgi:hypothetical protein